MASKGIKKDKKAKTPTFTEIAKQLDSIELEKKRSDEDNAEISHDLSNENTLMEDFDAQLSSNEPIRELFTAKNIKFKTEVTQEQRSSISILYHAYFEGLRRGFNLTALHEVLDQFVDFGVPVERKGRLEYVDAHKAAVQAMQMQNQMMMQKSSMENMKM